MSFMDIPRAAKVLQLTEEQLRRQLRSGKVPGRKVGDHWQLDAPPIWELYRRRGGLMPIPGDLVEVSIPEYHEEYIFQRHPHLKDVSRWARLLAEVDDWTFIHGPTDVSMEVIVANTVTGSRHEGAARFSVRLIIHESGELRQAEETYNPSTRRNELLVWGGSVRHYQRTPHERR